MKKEASAFQETREQIEKPTLEPVLPARRRERDEKDPAEEQERGVSEACRIYLCVEII
ncbi:hypothetical protein PXK00_05565 [Phaeobacter sp. QD34_3]|uniref:hypothetical protein n=1 Tax=unclassified Phaeobacter TaxID=2621772 RepID=UPI00237F51D7|nr:MULTISPECIES: hypothetical protein [unclassified Phaeobacter]MDE4132566.1 hypothetical protein [Phaeobacter sp. QD34_3]MDE4174435.1 hypothetical protein [Phaeobacter sp. PT47_59]